MTMTFHQIRPDHYHVERKGARIGSIRQESANAERNALRWRYWPEGQEPSPHFRTLEEPQQAVGDLY